MTTITKKQFKETYNSLLFVSKALPKNNRNDTRYYNLQYAMVKDNKVHCTDGSRLHIADLSELNLKDGIYKMTLNAKEINLIIHDEKINYPDVDRVIPDYDKLEEPLKDGCHITPWIVNKDALDITCSRVIGELWRSGPAVNYTLLKDLTLIDDWKIYSREATSPVLFVNCKHKAVIMPFRKEHK